MMATDLRLTEAEYKIVVSAMAYYETIIEDELFGGNQEEEAALLDSAGMKISRWHNGQVA